METQAWNAGQLMKTSGQYWMTCVLHAAVKLDVFSLLEGEGQGVEAVAEALGGEARSVAMLLKALCAMQLIVKEAGRYRNSQAAGEFLVKGTPRYIGYMILHHQQLMDSWLRLDEAVLSGRPVRERASVTDESWRQNFLMGMFNNAMAMAPQVVAALDFAQCRRLLDLGGGPGTYAIHFCRAYAQLEAVVFDLPTTRPFALQTIARFDLSERVAFQGGDYHVDPLPAPFDAVWLSHILHGEGEAACRALIAKAAAVLEPGGTFVVHEFILDDRRDGPLFPALFSLNMLLGTPSGRSYTEGELMEMLRAAGIGGLQRLPFCGPTQSGIILGTKA